MAAPLDASDPAITSTVKGVLEGTHDWVALSYVPGSFTKIKVDCKGSDGFEEVVDSINEGKVQYFYIRFQISNMPKYVYIASCGENVTGMQRGAFNSHGHEVANFFKKIQAPVHVQINARNEADFNEQKIKAQLTKAMGSNYDAGVKNQGQGGGVANTKAGVSLHVTAQQEAAKTNTARDLPNLPQLLQTRDEFWKDTNVESKPKPQAKTATPINEDERKQFWAGQGSATGSSGSQKPKTLIDENERQAFWDQQKKAEEERQAASKSGGVVDAPSGASALRSRFEQQQKPAEQAKPAPTGKKWTPPPAAPKPSTSAPLTSGPPKYTGPPVPSGGPPSHGPPVPSGGPPLPAKDHPPPFGAKPPGPPAGPPPVPGGGPPKPAGGPPPVPGGGPPKLPPSAPPPFVPPTPPAHEEPAEDDWNTEPDPTPEPPAQNAWNEPETPSGGYDQHAGGYDQHAGGYDQHAGGYDQHAGGYDQHAGGYDQNTGGYDQNAGGYDQNAGGYDQNAGGYDQNAGGYDQNAGGYDQSAGGYDQNAGGYDQTAGAGAEGDTVEALYAFQAEQPTDLSFNEGDLIVVLDKTDPSGWWKGRDASGNEGFFPSNFVRPYQ